jgi:hypothetical protein
MAKTVDDAHVRTIERRRPGPRLLCFETEDLVTNQESEQLESLPDRRE